VSRRFISELTDATQVDEVFRASGKQLRPNRNGNLYLQVQLSDRTGSITAMLWNANDRIYRSFQNGDFVHIDGTAQLYNGNIQVIATQIERVEAVTVDEADFLHTGSCDLGKLMGRLKEIVQGIKNIHLRNLVECFLVDEEFMERFTQTPAGIKIHHAYRGGLLEHVVTLMELAQFVGQHYVDLDAELLTVGAFIHDIGKTIELSDGPDMEYTDEGQLIGHVTIGVNMLDDKVRETDMMAEEPIPQDLVLQLKHMIVSHHGTYEYGSPKLPMTLEAIALHYLDSLDSKVQSFAQTIRDDPNSDNQWTSYQVNLGRKLFKGRGN